MAAAPGEGEETPDDRALERLYEEERDRFQSPPRRRVAVIFFAAPAGSDPAREAGPRAQDAYKRLGAGEPFDDVAKSGDPLVTAPPDALLPIAKLSDYLGATAARALVDLKEGESTPPLRGADGYRILRLVEVKSGSKPDFNAVRAEVLAEYRRRRGDDRVRGMIDRRRAESEIVVAPLP
jgi:hypothetical protein